ncbi:MAG TPA: alpha/beta hydrolase [Ferrovibrio sp.]|uniref:alpha/beta fold hydrolase n=1 Tax=Ferrovibrio sp. TaxID=1917215 RepID=UPI002B4B6318|nr:alpha/beta hydrolase [Ferrovibrio sp.]HLT78551.1 alpha/beta hydrolase [Ferrovibrio sp.]
MREPLVLVPGLLLTDDFWREQVARLSDVAQCIVPSGQYDHDNVADMARAVLAEAPERFSLCGLSMGGYVCLEIMRQAPERVTRLALLDTSARPDSPEQTERRSGFIKLARIGRFKGVTPQLLPFLVHPDNVKNQAIVDRLMAMAETIGRDRFIRHQEAIMARPDSRPDLPNIRVPTLVLCGRHDALTPVEVHEEMARLIPGAELVIIEEAGHLPPMETPDQTAAALRNWLKR